MPSKTPSILVAAVAYAVLSLIISFVATPGAGTAVGAVTGVLSCLLLLGVGMLAVWHYTSTHQLTVPGGTGAGMGASAGAIGAIIAGLVSLALVAAGIIPDPQELAIQELERQGMSDEQIDMVATFSNPIIGLVIGVVLAAIVGAVGGAIGAAVFKRGGDQPSAPAA